MDITALDPGQTICTRDAALTADLVERYVAAVQDDSRIYGEEGLVPPMAVAALVMAAAMEEMGLPAGAVHTGQELTFVRPVPVGSMVRCTAVVASNSVRRGTRFLALDLTGAVSGAPAVEGRTTLAVAEEER